MDPGRRAVAAALVACIVLVVALLVDRDPRPPSDPRPNVLLVVTDDQTADSLEGDPSAMPWLRAQLEDPGTGWRWFPDAIAATPMCCPSRATLLTGLTAEHHGVASNEDGTDLDESDTLATWLHDAGYATALVGKYLNGYPWDRGPYVPPGWDRWFAKTNEALATTYFGYGVVDDGRPRRFGTAPPDYVTDVLGREALGFVRSAPTDRPWFLLFAPPAGHAPWIPAPRHAGTLTAPPPPDLAAVNDVEGKPAWVQGLPPIDAATLEALEADRVRARETLLAVDGWLEDLWRAVVARGEAGRTVIVVLSDNGFHFGEHRWVGKQAPYEPSIRIPFAVRTPWADGGVDPVLVSTLDVAPTIAALAGIAPPASDGVDLSPALRGEGSVVDRSGIPIAWAGGEDVPAWSGERTLDGTTVTWADGTIEAYVLGEDPDRLDLDGPV
jgi:arylsulfatase A-like enzyme